MTDGSRPEPRASGAGALPRLLPRRLARPGTLAGDWLGGDEGARRLVPAAADPGGGEGAGSDGDRRFRLDPDAVRVSGKGAARRLVRIADGEGVLVTTGQQPVLFLGPLYVLYKALTALEAARRLEREGTPALALFWVAGDDHDWAEIGRCRLLDTGNALRTLRLDPPRGREGRAAGPTSLPDGITDLVDEMSQLLPSSEFVGRHLERLRDAWRPGRRVADAFGASLEAVLGDRPFAWLDASSSAVRRAAAPLFRRVVEEDGATARALELGAERVEEAGYAVQMPPREGGLPLFVDDGGRRRLHASDADGFSAGRGGEPVSRERVLRLLEAEPEAFSPSGELRPVLESWLLPVAATALGPSEVAYWAQLGPLFAWADVRPPRVLGRRSWTVVEGKVGKVLAKIGAEVDDFRDGGEGLAERIADEGRPEPVEDALGEARGTLAEAMETVERAVSEALPGIRSAVGAARHEAFGALDRLEDAVDDRVREQHEVTLRQIEKAAAHLRPDGAPQERVLSPLYYLARYGEAFVDLVDEATRELGPENPGTSGQPAAERDVPAGPGEGDLR